MKFEGLYTALITPFTPNDTLDEKSLITLIQRQLETDINGLLVLGVTGEAPTVQEHERIKIIELAVSLCKGKKPLIVGTGSYSTHQAIQWTQMAAKLGADGALIVTPYYNKPSQEGLFRHFGSIAESSSLPICLYDAPGRTAINLLPDTVKRLFQTYPSIKAIKTCSPIQKQIEQLIHFAREHNDDFTVLTGNDEQYFALQKLGIHGLVSAASNLIPQTLSQLLKLCREKPEEAKKLNETLHPFFSACFVETNPVPIKAMLEMKGLSHSQCRSPLCQLSKENHALVKEKLSTLSI